MRNHPGLVLEAIRDGVEFTLYRRRQSGRPSPVLVAAVAAKQPSPQRLHRLKDESTRSQPNLSPRGRPGLWRSRVTEGRQFWLSPTRAVRLSRDGEKTLEMARLPRLANNVATALRHLYQRGLMRLLAKNAKERYQTAAGQQRRIAVDPFRPGTDGSSDRSLIPEKLHRGRVRSILLSRQSTGWRMSPASVESITHHVAFANGT